jgi:hypothetical protein
MITDKRKQIIVFPRGQLSANDRRNLLANGVLPVEAGDPSKVALRAPDAEPVAQTKEPT